MSVDTDHELAACPLANDAAAAGAHLQHDRALPAPLLDDDAGDVAPLGARRLPPSHPAHDVRPRHDRRPSLDRRRARLLTIAAAAAIVVLAVSAVALRPSSVVNDSAPARPPAPAPRAMSSETVVDELRQAADAARHARYARTVQQLRAQRRQTRMRAARRAAARKRVIAQRRRAEIRATTREARRRAAAPSNAAASSQPEFAPAWPRSTPPVNAVKPRTERAPARPACGEFDLC
jgi:hypothetical protein